MLFSGDGGPAVGKGTERDADAGRRGARLQAGIIVWLTAYMGSFTSSPPPDAPLPELTVER